MNKLTKIGVSALCGSLASVAANAGTMEVIGGATMTYSSTEGGDTGNPLGMHSGLTFKGSGELDNGTTFSLTITGADQAGYSSGSVAMTVPGLGGLTFTQAAGGAGLDRYDDKMPTAWEETNGTSLGTGLVTVAGVGTSMNIEWTASSDMVGDGLHLGIAVAPGSAAAGVVNDKAMSGSSGGVGGGYDITIGHTGLMDGLELFAGVSSIDQDATTGGYSDDRSQYAAGLTYAMGSFTVGYQVSHDNFNRTGAATTAYYENSAYGVSFAVNDDLSISYGNHTSERGLTAATEAPVELEAESLQIAYSMGGMSVKIAESSVDNANYASGTGSDNDGRTIAVTLAF
jgi:outer membrane protein OmpU